MIAANRSADRGVAPRAATAGVLLGLVVALSGPVARTAAVHRGVGVRAVAVAVVLATAFVVVRSLPVGARTRSWIGVLAIGVASVAVAGGRLVGAWSVLTLLTGLAVSGRAPSGLPGASPAVRVPTVLLALLSAYLAADPTVFAAAVAVSAVAASVVVTGMTVGEALLTRSPLPPLALGLLGWVVTHEPNRALATFGVVYGVDGAAQTVAVALSLAAAAVVPRGRGDLVDAATAPAVVLTVAGVIVARDRQRLTDAAVMGALAAFVVIVAARCGSELRRLGRRGRTRLLTVRRWLPDRVWLALLPGVAWTSVLSAVWVRGRMRSGGGGFRALEYGLDPPTLRPVFAGASLVIVPLTVVVLGSIVTLRGGRRALGAAIVFPFSAVAGAALLLAVGWVFPGVVG